MPADALVFEDFQDHVGKRFPLVADTSPPIELVLDSATPLPAYAGAPIARPPFSLIFLGPGEFVLPQVLHTMRHPALGEIEVFLVPIGKDQRGVSYQALFN